VDYLAGPFWLTFDLSNAPTVRRLRWDPVELRFCRVRLDEIRCEDRAGKVTLVDPAAAVCNGVRRTDGVCEFETLDPCFLLPVTGELSRVSVRGTWNVEDKWSSVLSVGQRLQEKNQEIAGLRMHLHNTRLRRLVSGIRSAWHWVKPRSAAKSGRCLGRQPG
jgi:hypothetical protein